jgi:hypothetical protein
VTIPQAAPGEFESFLETSDNIIVEAVRRGEDHIELRFVECLGLSGMATVKLSLPHGSVHVTDLVGRERSTLPASGDCIIQVQPQEIVTLHFQTDGHVTQVPIPISSWDSFVPKQKLAALHAYDPDLRGHPPFGDGGMAF